MRVAASLPRGLRVLAWSGTLPFVAALAVALFAPDHVAWGDQAFIAYGALILSFLGGSRWGLAIGLTRPSWRLAESVIPSLLGFAALLVGDPRWALALLAFGFAAWLCLDLADPAWPVAYRRLRVGVSVFVLALHGALLVAYAI